MEEVKIEVGEQPNSCKLSVNAKGMFSGEVIVYGETIEEATTKALQKAKELKAVITEQNKKEE